MPDTDASPTNDSAEPLVQRDTAPPPREVLVRVFPGCHALPLPAPGEALGRSWLASHGIHDQRVSEQHVLFLRRGGRLQIADASSTHGTCLNGQRMAPGVHTPLTDQSVIRLAGQVFVYCEHFVGKCEPDTHDHGLISPFGLRSVLELVAAMHRGEMCNVLIEGETGTGKEVLARFVAAGFGRGHNFRAVNVGAIARGLVESELFGKLQGAFTGATTSPGHFVNADGGALLLDEVVELTPEMQLALLRVLQEREVLPVGSSKPRRFDAQILAATNGNLESAVEQGKFRSDLFYRLAEVHLVLPPLRVRKEDIVALVGRLIAVGKFAIDTTRMNADAIERLLVHPWKGNVRELNNALRRIAAVSPGPLVREGVDLVLGPLDTGAKPKTMTEDDILRLYEANGRNNSKTARDLGMDRSTFKRRLAAIQSLREQDALVADLKVRALLEDREDEEEPR